VDVRKGVDAGSILDAEMRAGGAEITNVKVR
jgi:hypothetical protein